MTVEFYISQDVDYINERRALARVAWLLQRHYGRSQTDHFVLVANVPELQSGLTQLDAVLLGPKFVAVLDFKNYADPIDGRDPHKAWLARPGKPGKPVQVEGGSAKNPYQQACRAHREWGFHLEKEAARIFEPSRRAELQPAWRQLNGWVLFYPYLHPNSRIMHAGKNHLWLNFRGVDDVVRLTFEVTSDLQLTRPEMRRVATTLLAARPWPELARLFDDVVGYLVVTQPDQSQIAYPVRPFDTLTVGRSRHHHLRLAREFSAVSGSHGRLETQGRAVRLFDLDSRHGTFVNGDRVDGVGGRLLSGGDTITLGGLSGEKVGRLRFDTHSPGGNTPTREAVTQVTGA